MIVAALLLSADAILMAQIMHGNKQNTLAQAPEGCPDDVVWNTAIERRIQNEN